MYILPRTKYVYCLASTISKCFGVFENQTVFTSWFPRIRKNPHFSSKLLIFKIPKPNDQYYSVAI